ncbi:MAG: methionyl-tRNA formyltransferase [Betaproteobacteria bacterium]|nr:methionyl-tRNA formyltransferase [Betaproteobacteria bacterium]
MKLIFAGTPAFAATALSALIAAGHEIMLVLTQPDRPAGRGLKPAPSEVKKLAQRHGLGVEQPLTLKDAAAQASIAHADADAMIVAAYGLILPKAVLALPRLGCINIHASLLPRWRGAAPIQRAILAGDAETGITIMQMDEGLDTGDMLLRRATPIGSEETAGELHDRLAALGGELIVQALQHRPAPIKQDAALATYAAKITKEEALIDWRRDALSIQRQVRAYHPFPGALTTLNGERIKLARARVVALAGAPGVVCASAPGALVIACGSGAIEVTQLQRAGGKTMPTAAFLAGFAIAPGAQFGS